MKSTRILWLRRFLLTCIYLFSVLGVLGSGGSSPEVVAQVVTEVFDEPFTSDGSGDSLETDFDPTSLPSLGVGGFNARILAVAPATDSSDDVYVGGSFTAHEDEGVTANRIARVNNDGTLDSGFVSGTGFDHEVLAISTAMDSSGDIYVGGKFTHYNGTVVGGIARLNLDGSLDTGFASGIGFENIGSGTAVIRQITPAIDGSDDIYVAGEFTGYDGTVVDSPLVRLNGDGSLDTGFDAGDDDWGESGFTLANDGSGDVYITRKSSPGIARLNDDGSIDTQFDTGASGFNGKAMDIGMANDGSEDVYVVGDFDEYNGSVTIGIARLNSDGSFDAGFVTGSGFFDTASTKLVVPAIDGSGDVYIGGNPQSYQDKFIGRLVRLKNDGTIDTSFIHKFFPFVGFNDQTRSIALANDGSGDVYVGGGFTSYGGAYSSVDHLVSFTVDGNLKFGRLD